MKRIIPALLATAVASSALAQQPAASLPRFADPANLSGERMQPRDGRELPIDQGKRGLEQMLRRLNTRASILNIVAHPDDEDGGMLTFYARGMGARVADLSLTRGEGGQNAMTGDFEDALGLLRTQELLANDRYVGITQMFGTEVDFGFSKTKAESFGKWTHERVLYDAVRAIRIFRPLVITSTWIGGVTDGHGQHQVSGQIAQEAFVAAGDPKVFPEMEKEGIYPWQPLRVYARVPHSAISKQGLYDYATNQYVPAEFHNYVTGKTSSTPPEADVGVHEGQVDPLLSAEGEGPVSYVQFARRGLSQQKSQMGPGGRSAPEGAFDVAYHLYGSRVAQEMAGPKRDFFDGIDTSLVGIADVAPEAPASLRTGLQHVQSLLDQATQKLPSGSLKEIDALLQQSAASMDELLSSLREANAQNGDSSFLSLSAQERASLRHELLAKRAEIDEARYFALGIHLQASAPSVSGDIAPGNPLAITVQYDAPYATLDEAKLWELNIRSESNGTANPQASTILLTANDIARFRPTLPYFKRNNIEQPIYDLTAEVLRNAPLSHPPLIVQAKITAGLSFTVPVVVTNGADQQPLQILPSTPELRAHLRAVGYGDLPRTNFIERPAKFIAPAGLRLPEKRRIGYLPGTGDAVPEALAAMGLHATKLTVGDLTAQQLSAFDTVILGVRTYAAHSDLHGSPTQELLEFARNGGNVIVQYQTTEFVADDAPFPLSLGANEKVVDETAPVKLLDAKNTLLTTPNVVTSADFNGWVEERGHGFLETWDARYTALTETHDPGAAEEHILPQKPQRGGIITASLGKGHWTYVAFALYRQFPEAVPGAYRLFANLLAQ
ncbi:PIG-L family deacetylase [Granulicella cerasi]|uniref:PIG-L family deacetylase n=1 Tax=Granulicella cerasi TaxID=741063 RepID=A0ABW1ZDZ5_9BACT|nr:PIG-L family deacetylase [Granulicella cerasi]